MIANAAHAKSAAKSWNGTQKPQRCIALKRTIMKYEMRIITPEMATAWLEKNTRNRALNPKRVQVMAKDMRQGNWMLHHQGIAFYADGTLADGQTRLAAIVAANTAIPMYVFWGLPETSGLVIDGQQKRGAHQSIKISGLADWIDKDAVATARVMLEIENNGIPDQTTMSQLIGYCEKHKEAIVFACKALDAKKRNITHALNKGCVASAYYYEDEKRLGQFCTVLSSGVAFSIYDRPAIMFREWLIEKGGSSKTGGQRVGCAKRAMRAIKAFCGYEVISKLYQPKEFLYTPKGVS